ncbi:DinB family protein [Telluribacter sp. SYSU D00476]|uniref:DinB family protein n=1 Tax=Telluribacter sp. SYSU D00476 TaxID=2811430 RepID=UPI001FF1798C|nr:DinB family protein [Telluribacter sp. SYSU D00476]
MKTEYIISDLVDELTYKHQDILSILTMQLAPLSDAQKVWKPAPTSWSITECLAHLNLTHTYYIRQIQKKVDDVPHTVQGTPDRRFIMSKNGRLMLKALDPASTWKLPAPAMARPRTNPDPDSVFDRFVELENLFLELLPQTTKLDLEGSKVISPFFNWLKFRAGDVLIFVTAHTQRHLNQALRVTQLPGFPRS